MESENGGNNDKDFLESSANSTPHEHRSFAEFAKDKLDSAGRELRRRLPMAGQIGAHLMHPRRLMLQSTPSQQTDVVLIFPKGIPDSVLLWLLQKLRGSNPRLRVYVRQHSSTQSSAFYITADDDVLLQTAEEVHLPKLLKPEYGGGYKEFTVRDMDCFQGGTSVAELLNSQERASLVKHALEACRAAPRPEPAMPVALHPGQSIVPACLSRGIIESMFPLHEKEALEKLRKKWVKTFFSPQPLDEISEYFGVKIAMYFAWLGHYTTMLTIPAVVGCVFWVWIGTANEYWRDIAYVLFSLFNALWACVYLETWKRYSNVLAYKWGTLDQRDELLVEPRPLFQGEMSVSPVTGRPEPHYSAWKRRVFRLCVSFPCLVVCLAVCATNTLLLLKAQDWWEKKLVYFSWIPRAVLGIVISVEEVLFARIAKWLNDKGMISKIIDEIFFQFVNSFMSLFYVAFYLQDMDKLKEQLAVLLITRQLICNLKESALPYLIENLRLAKICVDAFGAISPSKMQTSAQIAELFENKKTDSETPDSAVTSDDGRDSDTHVPQTTIHQAEFECQLFQYEGTFSEFVEMLTQLGHVLLFSSAFPLAAACALLSNACEIRAAAFRLCHVARRAFPQRVKSVGVWQHAMEAMVAVAVLVNCALIGLSGPVHRLLPEATPAQTVLVIVALEGRFPWCVILRTAMQAAMFQFLGWCAVSRTVGGVSSMVVRTRPMWCVRSDSPRIGRTATDVSALPRTMLFPWCVVFTVYRHVILILVLALRLAIPSIPSWLETEMAKVEFQRREAIKNSQHRSECLSQDDLRPSPRTPQSITPTTPKQADKTPDKKKVNIGKISEIPPFRTKAASINEPVAISTGSLHILQDVSPTKPIRRKLQEGTPGAPLSLLGIRGLRDEPLHRSAHCIPHPTQRPLINPTLQELSCSVSAGGSEPDLNAPSPAESATELDKPKDKTNRSRAKAALVKRVRSVAVFSLGLRRAREAAAQNISQQEELNKSYPANIGGELSLIPIEQLIQVDDVKPRPT